MMAHLPSVIAITLAEYFQEAHPVLGLHRLCDAVEALTKFLTVAALGEVRRQDLDTAAELHTLTGHTNRVDAVAVTPDGRRAVSGPYDKTLKVWDLDTGAVLATFQADASLYACALAPDGVTLVAGDKSGRVHFLRLEGVTPEPPYVTAWRWQGSLALGCPHCRRWSETPKAALGTQLPCPQCGKLLKINPFTIDADWRLIAQAWQDHAE
jgi:hypothetical protein